jgi:hypothetical protein
MLAVALIVLIAGHLIVPYLLAHRMWWATVLSGAIALIVVKHLGLLTVLFGPLYKRFRGRPRW